MITQSLQITYPIIQAPMLGVSTPAMAAAAANEGGLGSLPVGGLSPEMTRQLIQATKKLTGRPFAVNIFVHELPAYTEEQIRPMKEFLLELAGKKGYPLTPADLDGFRWYTYHDQAEVLWEENISIISFTFGCPGNHFISRFKEKGCTLIGTATSVEEARFLEEKGVDMITVQGIEAGGHRGTFLENVSLPEVGLFSLLPQIKNFATIPCIAAGGINNAATMKAAFELGADAVQVGTAFIGTAESEAIPSYKNKVSLSKDTDSVLTRAFSGRWARGIKNEMMQAIENAGIPIPPYPVQNSLTAKLRKLAQLADDGEYTNIWAGQSAGSMPYTTTKELMRSLVKAYENGQK